MFVFLESCPSWPKEHDWKSCRRVKLSQGFESLTLRFRKQWPVGQAVKTPPFHGGNTGSIPVRVIINFWRFSSAGRASALQAGCQRFDPVNLHYNLVLVWFRGVGVNMSACHAEDRGFDSRRNRLDSRLGSSVGRALD